MSEKGMQAGVEGGDVCVDGRLCVTRLSGVKECRRMMCRWDLEVDVYF